MKEECTSSQTNPDRNYWEKKWQSRETGWDIGYSSPPIEEYILQYSNKEVRILIPGCGNAYEVEFFGISDLERSPF